jgi:AraC-like DNA-binding protein
MTTVKSLIDIPLYQLEKCSNGAYFMIDKYTSDDEAFLHMREPHRFDGYGIDIILRGTSRYTIDFQEYTVHAPALVLIAPEQIHTQSVEDGAEILSISFLSYFLTAESEDVIGYLECTLRSNVIPLSESQLRELLPLTEFLLRESRSNQPYKDTVVRNLLNTLVIACARMQPACVHEFVANLEKNTLISRFKMLVNQHYSEKVQVAQYADLLSVTPGHLNDTVKAVTGKTAKQIIDEKRVLEAKRLLFWANHPVKEISWKLNFEDDAYFSRFFKKHTGRTPLEFQSSVKSTAEPVIM